MSEERPLVDNEPEDDPPAEGAPLWVLTFGDLMSLLLCFFVLMFSMSEVRVEKFLIAAESLRDGLGHGSSRMTDSAGIGGTSAVDTNVNLSNPAPYDITIAMEEVDDLLQVIHRKLYDFVVQSGLSNSIEVTQTEDSVRLSIQDVVLFDTGSAELRPESRTLMEELGRIVAEFSMPVVVAGHTDDRPIRTLVFPSNWELSSARASTVTRILLAEGHPADRVYVEGYAEYRPVDTNATEQGRARNRRVEILYTRQAVIDQLLAEKRTAQESVPSVLTESPGAEPSVLTNGFGDSTVAEHEVPP
jgi:chemotaxis protein MotB